MKKRPGTKKMVARAAGAIAGAGAVLFGATESAKAWPADRSKLPMVCLQILRAWHVQLSNNISLFSHRDRRDAEKRSINSVCSLHHLSARCVAKNVA